MKKLILSFVIMLIIFSISIGVVTLSISAEGDDVLNKGIIFVNGLEIASTDTAIIKDDEMFLPLRAILEALGSTVSWEQETGNILFDFAEKNYVCKCRKVNRQNFPPINFILIHDVLKQEPLHNADYIQLNPMSGDGVYCIINDRTYLTQETGKRLFEALGCKVEIESDTHTVKIFD